MKTEIKLLDIIPSKEQPGVYIDTGLHAVLHVQCEHYNIWVRSYYDDGDGYLYGFCSAVGRTDYRLRIKDA